MTAAVQPLVSIVTPTLNQGRFIEHTIRSIKSQTYRNVEHIVVDGGSTDETLDILRRHEGTYNLRWLSEPDRGMYDAINTGMRLATGEILAYLNSDDLYFPWTLEVVIDAFRHRPKADFIYGDALGVEDETGRRRMSWHPPFNLDYVRRIGFLTQPTVFWRRRVLGAIGGFDESVRYVADCDYWMKAGEHCSFRKVNEVLAVERDHRSSQRESSTGALANELREVRSRYVTWDSPHDRTALARDVTRERVWKRIYWIGFLLQTRVPGPLRRGPWRQFLAADKTKLITSKVVQTLLPRQGDLRFELMTPSRHWLEPR